MKWEGGKEGLKGKKRCIAWGVVDSSDLMGGWEYYIEVKRWRQKGVHEVTLTMQWVASAQEMKANDSVCVCVCVSDCACNLFSAPLSSFLFHNTLFLFVIA